jgi:hypothetical protein
MQHQATRIFGFHLHATDGPIGHLDDLVLDEQGWLVRYLVVDTSNWLGGRSVLISPSVVTAIDAAKQTIMVSLTRDQIQQSPSIHSADIPLAEALPTIWIM